MKCGRPILALLLLAGTAFAQNGRTERPLYPPNQYSLVVDVSSCTRKIGEGKTKSEPWKLKPGRTWTNCRDDLKRVLGPPYNDYLTPYMAESILRDFEQGGDAYDSP